MLVAPAGAGKTIITALLIAFKRLTMKSQKKELKIVYVFPTYALRDRDELFIEKFMQPHNSDEKVKISFFDMETHHDLNLKQHLKSGESMVIFDEGDSFLFNGDLMKFYKNFHW